MFFIYLFKLFGFKFKNKGLKVLKSKNHAKGDVWLSI